MKYMLLLYADPNAPAEDNHAEYVHFTQEILNSGEMVAGDALQSTDTATSVRVRAGDVTTTDGPFAETKEWLNGFYLVDCKDLDRAIQLAATIPAARHGTVEIRPVWEIPDMPTA